LAPGACRGLAVGNVFEFNYDKALRRVGIRDPLGNVTKMERDAAGQVIGYRDANGNFTGFKTDALRRPTRQTDANGNDTTFSYDNRGNLISLTDPNGNSTTFSYDRNKRVVKETSPMGQVIEYSYYPNGLLKSRNDAKGQLTTYNYDKASRLLEKRYADGKKDTFSYDAVGNLRGYANESVSGAITYDEANRKVTETETYGALAKTFSYTYDTNGNRASLSSSDGQIVSYGYDKNGRLKTVSMGGKTFSYEYDRHRLIRKKYPNGTLIDYSYNANSWLTRLASSASSAPGSVMDLSYDNVGNITSKTTGSGNSTYTYDSIYRLLGMVGPAKTESFAYDNNGNRITSGGGGSAWIYNKDNQFISSESGNFVYDANGNVVKKADAAGVTTYVWDARDKLSQVVLPDGSTTSFTYDALGRRIGKTATSRIDGVTTSSNWSYFYDNASVATEIYGAGGGSESTFYIDGANVDEHLAFVRNGHFYYYLTDNLGSVISTTDENGTPVQQYGYDSFGLTMPSTAFRNSYTYTGREWDKETGLYYYRLGTTTRWRGGSLARTLSPSLVVIQISTRTSKIIRLTTLTRVGCLQ
jgi:YD repeat-containing protein